MAQWKDHGPGNCCCATCWYWLDDFADGDLTQPTSGENRVRWPTGHVSGAFVNVVGSPGFMRILPTGAAQPRQESIQSQPTNTQTPLSQGYSFALPGRGLFTFHGIYRCRVQVESDAVAMFSFPGIFNGASHALAFDRPSGRLYVVVESGSFATRITAPVHFGVPLDMSEEMEVEIHVDFARERISIPHTLDNSYVVMVDGVELMRFQSSEGGASQINPFPTLYPGYSKHGGKLSISGQSFSQGFGTTVLDAFLTPTNTNPTGQWRLYDMRFDASSRTAPSGAGCETALSDYWVGYDPAQAVRFQLDDTTSVDCDIAMTPFAESVFSPPRQWSGGVSTTPGAVIHHSGLDYLVQLTGVTAYGLQGTRQIVDMAFQYREQTVPIPPWSTFFMRFLFDGAIEYEWPLRHSVNNLLYIGSTQSIGTSAYSSLFGSGWEAILYQGTL